MSDSSKLIAPEHGDPNGAFLKVARGETPSRRPMWIMRQAGRYLPEYREIRKQHSFLDLCNNPEAAAEVTMQPIRRYGFDAAILFTDLMVPVVPMGLGLRYDPGPVLDRRIETQEDVDAILIPDPERDLSSMLETACRVRMELDADKALIGFVGAPFTIACYLVDGRGSKHWERTRQMLHGEPEVFDKLLAKIVDGLIPLVGALVRAGCDAIQIFDSWAGVVGSGDYRKRCAKQTARLLAAAREAGAIATNFVNGAGQHMETMREAPADILAVDWRHDIADLRARAGNDVTLQGNLDPTALFADEKTLRARVRAICDRAGPNHVFNLGHGILPPTDPDALRIVADEVWRTDPVAQAVTS